MIVVGHCVGEATDDCFGDVYWNVSKLYMLIRGNESPLFFG